MLLPMPLSYVYFYKTSLAQNFMCPKFSNYLGEGKEPINCLFYLWVRMH